MTWYISGHFTKTASRFYCILMSAEDIFYKFTDVSLRCLPLMDTKGALKIYSVVKVINCLSLSEHDIMFSFVYIMEWK